MHEQSEHLPAIGRLAVALVLVQLARGDYVAAEKAFKEWGNCCEAPEVQNCIIMSKNKSTDLIYFFLLFVLCKPIT